MYLSSAVTFYYTSTCFSNQLWSASIKIFFKSALNSIDALQQCLKRLVHSRPHSLKSNQITFVSISWESLNDNFYLQSENSGTFSPWTWLPGGHSSFFFFFELVLIVIRTRTDKTAVHSKGLDPQYSNPNCLYWLSLVQTSYRSLL